MEHGKSLHRNKQTEKEDFCKGPAILKEFLQHEKHYRSMPREQRIKAGPFGAIISSCPLVVNETA